MIPPLEINHPWKLHLLLLFLLFLFLVFDGLVRGRMRCIRSHLSCSHKVGSKYLTLSVIVIRRRSPPSSPPLDMMHHVLLVLVLSTCPCWLSSCGFINLWTEGITPRLLDGQQHHYGRHGALFEADDDATEP